MRRFRIKIIAFFLLLSFCLFASCKKDKDSQDQDYRDLFPGTYICDYMKVSQTRIDLPDTIIYMYDTTYSYNTLFIVEKAGDPHKLLILGVEMMVYEEGNLEDYWVPGKFISGKFYSNDSISIYQGIGKEDGYKEYWWGKK